jgi:hypothetical protein
MNSMGMSFSRIASVVALTIFSGCGSLKEQSGAGDTYLASQPNPKPIVTQDKTLTGKIKTISPRSKFVVINFPIGHLPETDQHLFVYRNGNKVAELKVTAWQQDDNVVADILTGEVQEGDEVREK